jgi:hypothetical protein
MLIWEFNHGKGFGFGLGLIVSCLSLSSCSLDFPVENVIDSVAVESSSAVELTSDGAWCWFQDPRAVYISGNRARTYAGWMTHDGKLQVGAYDHDTGETEVVTIKEDWGVNDHNNNSFLVLPDNRIMIFYARHNGEGLFSKTTLKPEDITQWSDEIVVANTENITYSHPVYLSGEQRFYVFWRGENWKPTFATSTDGVTWTAPQVLLQDSDRDSLEVRPYLKVVSDGRSEIHFAFTDGHPRDEPENSIYYAKYSNGDFFKADNTPIGTMQDLPIQHSQSDVVFDGKSNQVRGWIWDIALDPEGHPVIAYTRLPEETDHRYNYAYWDGNTWLDNEITPGGKWFPQTRLFSIEKEPHYSGGIAIDHDNPTEVYLSREIGKVFEIEKWTTEDHGKTWISTAITQQSSRNNVRPVVPRGQTEDTDYVLWMSGNYLHYTNYSTGILVNLSEDQ